MLKLYSLRVTEKFELFLFQMESNYQYFRISRSLILNYVFWTPVFSEEPDKAFEAGEQWEITVK